MPAHGVKIVYTNSCIPQERVDSEDGTYKWYLDSDCSKKMSGRCEPTATIANNKTYYKPEATASGSANIESLSDINFVYIKNTGDNDLTINIGGRGARILLGPDESFAAEILSTSVAVASTSGTTYEYFVGID